MLGRRQHADRKTGPFGTAVIAKQIDRFEYRSESKDFYRRPNVPKHALRIGPTGYGSAAASPQSR